MTTPNIDDIEFEKECPYFKEKWETCFVKWSKESLLKGKGTATTGYEEYFEDYKACMRVCSFL